MTEVTTTKTASPASPASKTAGVAVVESTSSETVRGTTTIADVVVQKIAGLATREVPGVHALGGGAVRAFGALRERIPGASSSVGQGVSVEVGERQAAVDLQIVVEYGVSIAGLTQAVRHNVISAVEGMTGLEVVEVNIAVDDLHLPAEDEEGEPVHTGRVL
ncbi:Asp23/Gls24 family envelope stress response protein [Lentzea sp. NPDC060358]|uniref:Asp23/Gls24 family envelope stress response protein n=1 Tax=Lentzea sp. NPDC060358 TaxID=3347103 RepID=UPI0036600E2D